MNKTLYILGNGGQAKVCAQCYEGESIFVQSLCMVPKNAPFFIGIGDNALRKKLHKKAQDMGLNLINLIHPTAYVAKDAIICSKGSVLLPFAILHANAKIGAGCILNSGCVVEHDCIVGEFSHISVNAAMGGGVKVGKSCLVGVNATLLPGVSLDDYSTLGAGSVLTKSASGVLVGNPAKKIKE